MTSARAILALTLCALTGGVASCGGSKTAGESRDTAGTAGVAESPEGTGGEGVAGAVAAGGTRSGHGGTSSGGSSATTAAGGKAHGGAASGGSSATTAAGGKAHGGAASGGAASGGAASGGAAPGGAASGGAASGGAASGGAASGGAASGGAASGGSGGDEPTDLGGSAGTPAGGAAGDATGGAGGEPSWICGTSRCVPGASCDPDTGFCECDEGYEGDGWWCLSTAPCSESPCQNGGTCHPTDAENGFLCTCPPNFGGVHCEVPCSGNLTFPDPSLDRAVRQAAMLDDGEPITAEAAASINDLGIYEPISDFTGLECLTSVSWLSVDEGALTDLSPFAVLPRLSSLYAPCNPLLDLAGVASLINLTDLSLGQGSSCDDETGVTDISPLANLVGLVTLDLSGHNIESLAALKGLTRLERLILASNEDLSSLADLAPLSRLNYLVVTDTQVSDLSPFVGHNAIETLWLSGSMVADLTPIVSIASLKYLYIVATPVDCTAQADNIAALRANGVEVSSSCD